MITFKQYLQEARYRTDISNERAIDLLKAHCSDALKNIDTPLVRGARAAREEAYIFQGDLGSRTSAHSNSNHYSVLFDEFNGPEGYPLREKSVIMLNWAGFKDAARWGEVYAIFPFDGVKIGVCPFKDIWDGSPFQIGTSEESKNLKFWNIWFEDQGIPDGNFDSIVDAVEEILDDDSDKHYDQVVKVFTKGQVRNQLYKAYSAKSQRFQLADTDTVYDIPGAHELWISGKCVAIKLANERHRANMILKQLKEMLK